MKGIKVEGPKLKELEAKFELEAEGISGGDAGWVRGWDQEPRFQ